MSKQIAFDMSTNLIDLGRSVRWYSCVDCGYEAEGMPSMLDEGCPKCHSHKVVEAEAEEEGDQIIDVVADVDAHYKDIKHGKRWGETFDYADVDILKINGKEVVSISPELEDKIKDEAVAKYMDW
jgi:predicted  nucleic acid-binding Zn-ribbon protein